LGGRYIGLVMKAAMLPKDSFAVLDVPVKVGLARYNLR
jgi:hypothetical protein